MKPRPAYEPQSLLEWRLAAALGLEEWVQGSLSPKRRRVIARVLRGAQLRLAVPMRARRLWRNILIPRPMIPSSSELVNDLIGGRSLDLKAGREIESWTSSLDAAKRMTSSTGNDPRLILVRDISGLGDRNLVFSVVDLHKAVTVRLDDVERAQIRAMASDPGSAFSRLWMSGLAGSGSDPGRWIRNVADLGGFPELGELWRLVRRESEVVCRPLGSASIRNLAMILLTASDRKPDFAWLTGETNRLADVFASRGWGFDVEWDGLDAPRWADSLVLTIGKRYASVRAVDRESWWTG